MNKADLINVMAAGAAISKVQATRALDALVEGITAALKKGDRVALVGFGTFTSVQRKARMGRNPRSGQPLKIAARRVARFSTGSELKAVLNRGRAAAKA